MKDNYHSEDFSTDLLEVSPVATAGKGMRHSIRPRKSLADRRQKRLQELRPKAMQDEKIIARGTAIRKPQHDAVIPTRVATTPRPAKAAPALPVYVATTPAPAEAPALPVTPQWNDLPLATSGARRALTSAMPVVDAARDSDAARAFDLLRTKMRQTTKEKGWTNIAIAAPTSGCGTTFTAVNLALSLSRISGSRTVLMDMNLRQPGVAAAFDMDAPGAIGDYLTGQVGITDQMVRASDTLALGLSDQPDESAAEVLQDPNTLQTLAEMRAALRPQLVIYDMPPMLAHDDVSAFLPQLDGVLLVSDGTKTMGRQLAECERMLEGKVPLLGVVLNRARASSIPRYS